MTQNHFIYVFIYLSGVTKPPLDYVQIIRHKIYNVFFMVSFFIDKRLMSLVDIVKELGRHYTEKHTAYVQKLRRMVSWFHGVALSNFFVLNSSLLRTPSPQTSDQLTQRDESQSLLTLASHNRP